MGEGGVLEWLLLLVTTTTTTTTTTTNNNNICRKFREGLETIHVVHQLSAIAPILSQVATIVRQ
jgi:hypothetical protein